MIKAFLFDWGGVMSAGGRYDGHSLDIRLAKALHVTPAYAWQLIKPLRDLYSRGKLSTDELWASIEDTLKRSVPEKDRAIWETWETNGALPNMRALVADLKDQGYTAGLISNTVPDTAAAIRAHGGYDAFDVCILSYEVGFAKPDKEIYAIATQRLPYYRPEEIVFIDDQERFLLPAKQLGMQTLLAYSPEQVIADIHKLLHVK